MLGENDIIVIGKGKMETIKDMGICGIWKFLEKYAIKKLER